LSDTAANIVAFKKKEKKQSEDQLTSDNPTCVGSYIVYLLIITNPMEWLREMGRDAA